MTDGKAGPAASGRRLAPPIRKPRGSPDMTTTSRFTLHHAPRSRSARILWLLEEAGMPFDIAAHDLSKATHKDPAYLALNPAGKVPALIDHGPAGDWRP